jgi:hypothetical protein
VEKKGPARKINYNIKPKIKYTNSLNTTPDLETKLSNTKSNISRDCKE